VNHNWILKLVVRASRLQLSAAGSTDIFHPFGFARVCERNQESVRRFENIHWGAIDTPRLSPRMGENGKTGKASSEAAGDAVRNCLIKSRDPAFAEADQQNGRTDQPESYDYGDDKHDQLLGIAYSNSHLFPGDRPEDRIECQPRVLLVMKKNFWRAVIEAAFIVFLFYSNLLMGEFERTGVGRRHGLTWAIEDIFTPENFAIAIFAAIVGYLLFEFLRRRY
jgi:hypothetical protein